MTASAELRKKAETDMTPASNNMGPSSGLQAAKPAAFLTGSMAAAELQLPTPASQSLPASSEASTTSPFSRDNIVRNLQEMVKPAVCQDVRTVEDIELNEKQKSALQFAISMYMAANEFYDGGSLWCRQCDSIFPDILALCRHIHSDKHQLVSFTV